MSKENLTEPGFEPETSDVPVLLPTELSSPTLAVPKLSTIFAQGGLPVRSHKPILSKSKQVITVNKSTTPTLIYYFSFKSSINAYAVLVSTIPVCTC